MKKFISKYSLAFFITLFLISLFEIINFMALYKDQVDIGRTLLKLNNHATAKNYRDLIELDEKYTFLINFFKASSVISFLAILVILNYKSKSQKTKTN